jgi:hypothetical protein
MERLMIGLVVLGLMLAIMILIAWLAIRQSRREYDEEMRRLAQSGSDRERADPRILSAQTPEPSPS